MDKKIKDFSPAGILLMIRGKMPLVRDRNWGKIPYTTKKNGRYNDLSDTGKKGDGLSWWTNGFWGGLMWLMYEATGDRPYADAAVICERQLEHCFESYYGLHHDVGFMYIPTAVMHYSLEKDPDARRIALHAADLLASRFNPAGNFIRAWNGKDNAGRAIIDCMMNLNLLYWAAKETGDPRYSHIAKAHADTAMKHFIREDGSARHIVDFDPVTGAFLKENGGQGYGEGSAWTRGQAWAVYGFTTSYRHTKEERYLETARRAADFCLEHLPESGILPLDLLQPEEPAYEDECGAAILASGLLELAKAARCKKYKEAAIRILAGIDRERADYRERTDAIVQNCSEAYHYGKQHMTMVYADYFYVEAIMKLSGIRIRVWGL